MHMYILTRLETDVCHMRPVERPLLQLRTSYESIFLPPLLRQDCLDAIDELVDVSSIRLSCRDTHMSDSEVFGSDRLVQSACNHNVLFGELGHDIRRDETFGESDGRERVGGDFSGLGDEPEPESCELIFDLVRCEFVGFESVFKGLRAFENGIEGRLQRVDELHGG